MWQRTLDITYMRHKEETTTKLEEPSFTVTGGIYVLPTYCEIPSEIHQRPRLQKLVMNDC